MTHLPPRLALAAAFGAALANPASAQCLSWRDFPLVPPQVPTHVEASCVHDDGSGSALYVSLQDGPPQRLLRWDGVQVAPVGDGLPTSRIMDLVSFDDGSGPALYACGRATIAGVAGDVHLVRWNGASWQLVGGVDPDRFVYDIEVHDDGSGPALFISGEFASVGGVPAGGVAKWNGTTWSVVGPVPGFVGHQPVLRMTSHHDAIGPALCAYSRDLAAWSSSRGYALWRGASWTLMPFGPSSNPNFDLRSWDDGSGPAVYASTSLSIYRWTGGASWQNVGPGIGFAETLQVLDLGTGPRLYAGVRTEGFSVRAWNGATWAFQTPEIETACGNSQARTLAVFDDGSGPALYAGSVHSAFGTVDTGFTRWNGSAWVGVGPPRRGIDGTVRALVVHDTGAGPELYAGGFFCGADDQATSSGVVRWDGARWHSVGEAYLYQVFALATHDAGAGEQLFAGLYSGELWRWDGVAWTQLVGSTFPTQHRVFALQSFQGSLYVGGFFHTAGGAPSINIARWTSSGLQAVGSGTSDGNDDQVAALAVHDDGSGVALFAGGRFTSASGVPLANVGRFDGTSWSALGAGVNGLVDAFASFDEGSGPRLFAGGEFTAAGGVAATNVARWDGTSWSPVGAGLPGQVLSLGVYDDGSGPALHAGGNFVQPGAPEQHVARWNGVAWTFLGAGTDGPVWTMRAHDDGTGDGPELFVGGDFAHAGILPSNDVAAWRGCSGEISRFCFGDGSVATCPCGNQGVPSRGCQNSAFTGGARLNATGSVQPDTIELYAAGELPNAATLVFQGDALLANPLAFGDGLRCAGGHLVRLYTTNAVNGSLAVPGAGQPSVSARSAAQGDPIGPGDVRAYQAWYRDANPAFCVPPAGGAWNLSNAVRIAW